MGFSIDRATGQKCLVPGIYNPKHRNDNKVNLIALKGDIFPTYGGNEINWKQTAHLSVLLEYYLRYFGAKPN